MPVRTLLAFCFACLLASSGSSLAAPSSTSSVQLADAPAMRAEAVSGVAPVLVQPSPMTVAINTTAEQTLHASDADGDSLFFSKGFGPAYMTVFDVGPGGGQATGLIHLAPVSGDEGTASASVSVTDRTFQDSRTFTIQVTGNDRAPALAQPADMTAREGQTVDQALTATDPDNDPITFLKVAGPMYLMVETGPPAGNVAQGNLRIAPGTSDAGTATATIAATDGTLSSQRSLAVTVLENGQPFFQFVNSMFVPAGSTEDQTITATDPDNDVLTFSLTAGPTFVTVTNTGKVGNITTGNIHVFAPPPFAGQFFNATVSVTDGVFALPQSFSVFIQQANAPPVLSPISNMTTTEGEVVEQGVTASDPNNEFVQLSVLSGPPYVSISYVSFFPTVATILVAPGLGDAGVSAVTVQANDSHTTVTQTFFVNVLAGQFPAPCPGGTFATSTLGIGFSPQGFAVADVNGDENPDMLGTDYNDSLSVFLGNGAGSFVQGPRVKSGAGAYLLAVADLNSDARQDVVTANYYDNTFSVLLGTAGGFAPKHDYGTGASPFGVIVTDVNRDGKPDVATLTYNTGVYVARGLGDGTFLLSVGAPTGQPGNQAFASGDLNGDGAPDFVVVSGYPSNVATILLNDGSGGLTVASTVPVAGSPNDVALADLDGDGKLDLVTTGSSVSVSVRLGTGNGAFGAPRQFGITAPGQRLVVADWNGDGHPDVALTESGPPAIELLLGDGHGGLAPRTALPVSTPPFWIAAGDMNRDQRVDLVAPSSYTGEIFMLLNGSCAPVRDIPPRVAAPGFLATTENVAVSVPVTATDPDGDPIGSLTADVSGLPVGNNAALASNPAHTSGTFTWTPTFNDARSTQYTVVFRATNALAGSATTRITVGNVNRAPIASAGGPYTAFVGTPVPFDGGGSSDPDGNALTYKWVFGDGSQGIGMAPMHKYLSTGSFGVAVTVSDGTLTGIGTTTATIVGVIPSRAFTESGNRTIKLSSGKPEWCVQLEPVGRSYSNAAVDFTSIVMKSTGTGSVSRIPALTTKSTVGSDRDGNGVQEITACFGKTDLRNLFSSVHGTQSVTVAFEGSLLSGGIFRATMDLTVNGSGGGHNASVTPNPLNPDAILTFAIERAGPVRVRLFDLNGRLVRTLLDDPAAAAGYHDLRIDGSPLASGLYFYRIDAAEGHTFGKFSVLK